MILIKIINGQVQQRLKRRSRRRPRKRQFRRRSRKRRTAGSWTRRARRIQRTSERTESLRPAAQIARSVRRKRRSGLASYQESSPRRISLQREAHQRRGQRIEGRVSRLEPLSLQDRSLSCWRHLRDRHHPGRQGPLPRRRLGHHCLPRFRRHRPHWHRLRC